MSGLSACGPAILTPAKLPALSGHSQKPGPHPKARATPLSMKRPEPTGWARGRHERLASCTQPPEQRLALRFQLGREVVAELVEQFRQRFGLPDPGLAIDAQQLSHRLRGD